MAYQDNQNFIPNDSKIKKLIVLFVFENMSINLSENTLLDMCTSENNWLTYMECKQFFFELVETNLIYKVPKTEYFNLTQDGRNCLDMFYTRIPVSVRDQIANYTRLNRVRFKKTQSYFCDYSRNSDGSYTVIMKINNDMFNVMDLKLRVDDKKTAKFIYKNWIDQASSVYTFLVENLTD